MRQLYWIILLLITLSSCSKSVSDFGGYSKSENPEYGYNIILNHSDTFSYHRWEDGTKSFQSGAFLKFHSKQSVDTVFIWEGAIVIESFIEELIFNQEFIIVDQKPLDTIWGPIINKLSSPRRKNIYPNAREAIKQLQDSNIHQYWIINKLTNDIYCLNSRLEYFKKKKELGVPLSLKLTFE